MLSTNTTTYGKDGRPGDVEEGDTRSTAVLCSAARPARRTSHTIQPAGSPSIAQRNPTRSFYHRSFHGPSDAPHYSSFGVRDQTAELASLAISESALDAEVSRSVTRRVQVPTIESSPTQDGPRTVSKNDVDSHWSHSRHPDVIKEVSEPTSAVVGSTAGSSFPFASALTRLIRESSREGLEAGPDPMETSEAQDGSPKVQPLESDSTASEDMPLLSDHQVRHGEAPMVIDDIETQERKPHIVDHRSRSVFQSGWHMARTCSHTLAHPKIWNIRAVWNAAVVQPISVLPAVFLGLLLNILDALSYGMILFPLGEPIFEQMGSDGISMFYVSTIVAQVVFSGGGSVFKGGIGSEMIEVVPFMHKMAFTVLHRVGPDDPQAVLATTVLSYALSSILTGAVFFLMGVCRLGSLIGFFPRHILIGCIGGVGWFLVATGLEVSARLDGELNYDLPRLHKLFQLDTIFLWLTPLTLAVILKITQRFVKSNFLVGGYFIGVACLFYFFKFALDLPIETLRQKDWVFNAPPASNPWYHFYTLFDFRAVDWEALAATVPAMFALTFFGILHVPINVPALSISTGEDNLNLDRELLAHGLTNALSGCLGSIQNYLVYTNSLLFIESGGNSRLAGFLLALATAGILLVGPALVGYIPVMVVGALIFLLGIELMEEAVIQTWGRVSRLEYVTILVIIVTMGAWDFVIGIFVGIVLACVNYVVQTSRKSAVSATYSGTVASSTVRRPPVQLKFLKAAGQQTHIIKLTGFLFFGTIVGVESTIRALFDEDAFRDRPIRYLILDLAHIHGVDFSAAEAFTRISRILKPREVEMVVSGFDLDGDIGRSLASVGLFNDDSGVKLFENLNQALEYCENELLQALYHRQAQLTDCRRPSSPHPPSHHLDMPRPRSKPRFPSDIIFSSPRRHYLERVASSTLVENGSGKPGTFHNEHQPRPLLLQIFGDLSERGDQFWLPAAPFFHRTQFPQGTILFRAGDIASSVYLLEEGMLRVESDSPQGRYSELIMPGRPCGELPFFSNTERTAMVVVERDSSVWELTQTKWAELQKAEPAVASEMLQVCLKLTKERMDAVLGYLLTAAAG